MIGAMEKSKLVYILNRVRELAPRRTGKLNLTALCTRQDAAANLTISSPLEAHKPRAIIHSIVGVDVGFENPMFAALEVDYTESDQDPSGAAFESAEKVTGSRLPIFSPRIHRLTSLRLVLQQLLTYYELDLGLNHVVRKWSEATDPRANLLVQGD